MAELQRSVTTFRRSGSSGLVWDERLFSGDLTQMKKKEKEEGKEEEGGAAEFRELRHSKSVGSIGMLGRSHSTGGGRGFRAGSITPFGTEIKNTKEKAKMGSCNTLKVASAERTFPDSSGIPRSMQAPKVITATKVGAPQKTKVVMADV
ncbi:hypothetical protein C4D60_Mb10t02970 [Musa balbisiana]|uniref:Uncharacterized protein n=1 Tax=Musa balbisiana TaxID=52838 RepID=A0A4S8IV29_MUSBA|nr:hypothetical protein C4D60_Mb10t02970 [Musa balbisiana]